MRTYPRLHHIKGTIVRSYIEAISIVVALLLPAPSHSNSEIVLAVPPPPARIEHEPPHRDGYVWAPGYWEWEGQFFRWISGSFISEQRGHWVADHWEQREKQWHYVRGHWER